jgi:polyhydroxyalkanoate synthase
VNDNINFPGKAFRQWITEIYKQNKLKKKEFRIRGQVVDLANITAPVLVMAGENDHIVLPVQTKALLDMVSSTDLEYLEYPIGHGGLVFGSVAKARVYPDLVEWLEKRSSV